MKQLTEGHVIANRAAAGSLASRLLSIIVVRVIVPGLQFTVNKTIESDGDNKVYSTS